LTFVGLYPILASGGKMTELEVIHKYFDAWNKHDTQLIANTFSDNGTYRDPVTDVAIDKKDLKAHADRLISYFSDLSFEIIRISPPHSSQSFFAVQWIMKGTNTGALSEDIPPTDHSATVSGASFIEVGENCLISVEAYFDQMTVFKQLELDTIVQPRRLGPTSFGSCLRIGSGNKNRPGAMSLVWILARTAEEQENILVHTREIFDEWPKRPGFIGLISGFNQSRGFATVAWETVNDAIDAARRGPAHVSAMEDFGKGLTGGLFTGIWIPHHLNNIWLRCENCGTTNAALGETNQRCSNCNMILPEQPEYW
jgi:predicted ester cyclase